MLFTVGFDTVRLSLLRYLCFSEYVLSSVSSVSVRSMSGIWEQRNHISTLTPELNLPIFIRGTCCQLSKVEDLNFNSSWSGQSCASYSKNMYSPASAIVARDGTRSDTVCLLYSIPCQCFLHLISASPFHTCLY